MADTATVEFPSGLKRRVHGIATADIMTLAQATGARDVDVRLGLDDPVAGRITRFMVRSGLWTFLQSERLAWLRRRWSHDPTAGGAPHEIVIEVSGITPAGEAVTRRSTILDPAGQSHLTAVGTVAQIERLLGSRSAQLGPGVAVPETSPDAERLLSLLRSEAVQVNLAG